MAVVSPFVVALVAVVPPLRAAPVELADHRAFYEMRMGTVRQGSDVIDVRGGLAFQWGRSCDGYTVQQRAEMQFFYGEGTDREIGWTFVTWESSDFTRYRFTMRKTANGEVYEEVKGDSDIAGTVKGGVAKGGNARFRAPERKTLPIAAGSMFPTHHTVALIEAANAGRPLFMKPVFDGAAFEGPTDINAVIGRVATADEGLARADKALAANPLLKGKAWHVRLAFFAPDEPNEAMPEHEQALILQENGIARFLLLDYGDFTVEARLARIEPMPKPEC